MPGWLEAIAPAFHEYHLSTMTRKVCCHFGTRDPGAEYNHLPPQLRLLPHIENIGNHLTSIYTSNHLGEMDSIGDRLS
jgi:hypothetical protein